MCNAHNIIECTRSVCTQRIVASWCILSWGVLGWLVSHDIIGRVWLLSASLRLVIPLVVGPIVSSLPLLIVGGRLAERFCCANTCPNGVGGAKAGA